MDRGGARYSRERKRGGNKTLILIFFFFFSKMIKKLKSAAAVKIEEKKMREREKRWVGWGDDFRLFGLGMKMGEMK